MYTEQLNHAKTCKIALKAQCKHSACVNGTSWGSVADQTAIQPAQWSPHSLTCTLCKRNRWWVPQWLLGVICISSRLSLVVHILHRRLRWWVVVVGRNIRRWPLSGSSWKVSPQPVRGRKVVSTAPIGVLRVVPRQPVGVWQVVSTGPLIPRLWLRSMVLLPPGAAKGIGNSLGDSPIHTHQRQ